METSLSASTNNNPILICGPCSAESEIQILSTAKALQEIGGISYFRAGLWKPRTRPNEFEGVGEEGLLWLKQVKDNYHMKVCTEVATPYHVEKCLEYDIDSLWLGARTTSNPFSVDEIAESLKGTKKTIFVKNPLNPDIRLWIGAIERLRKKSIENIVAIHRGFSLTDNGKYRQSPLWKIPIELRREMPDMKIICDPSHIAGKRQYIKELSQMAMSIGFDGLMIEVHNKPLEAKTDALQQISPLMLKNIIMKLNVPNKEDSKENSLLASLRDEINDVDNSIINSLSRRMEMSKEIAKIKQEENLAVFQPQRWQEILTNISLKGEKQGLSKDFVKEIYEIIHQESIKIQNLIINKSIDYKK